MKNIAIFGASRSGKSTLSIMIAKKHPNYHILIGDNIRGAFSNVLPQTNINSKGGSGMKGDFQKFLSSLFYQNIKINKNHFNYIIETCDMEPEQAKDLFDDENTIILFLGFPNQTAIEHLQQIRKYETEDDWTYNKDEDYLLSSSTYWLQKSKEFKKKCKELNIWFVDTSYSRDSVLNDILKKLEDLL